MARAPDARAEQARDLFLSGKKLTEIAQLLDIPEGTVRSWKNRYKWENNDNAALRKKSPNTQRCKRKKQDNAKSDGLLFDGVLENPELTEKQRLFCMLYAKTLNATQAYKKAYQCSYESALAAGSRLLGNVRIKEEIQRLKKERSESRMFDEHDIFQWYLDIATASITDYVEFGREQVPVMTMHGPITQKDPVTGEKTPVMKELNFVKFHDSSDVDGCLIKKVKIGKDGASIELYDAMASMEWLAEHMSMGTTGQQGLAQSIMATWKDRKEKETQKPGEEDGTIGGT